MTQEHLLPSDVKERPPRPKGVKVRIPLRPATPRTNINLGGIEAGGRPLLPTIRPSTFKGLRPALDRGLIDRILEDKTTFTTTSEEARRIQDAIGALPLDLQEEAIERFERGVPSPRLGVLGAVGLVSDRLQRSAEASFGTVLRGTSLAIEAIPDFLKRDTAFTRKIDEFAVNFEQQEGGFFEKARKAEIATDFPTGVKGAGELLTLENLIPIPVVDQLLGVGLRVAGRAGLRSTRVLLANTLRAGKPLEPALQAIWRGAGNVGQVPASISAKIAEAIQKAQPAIRELVTEETGRVRIPGEGVRGDAVLPRDLAGAKPRFNFGQKQFTLSFSSDLDKAAYILAQTTKSRRDADYLQFVMDSTGLDEVGARAMGRRVRDRIKEQARSASPGELRIETLAAPAEVAAAAPSPREALAKVPREEAIKTSSDALLISDVALPERAAGGVPPITPTRPVEAGITPPEPPSFPGIEDALAKAHAITEVDLPGVVSNFVQKIPVVGGLRELERPALGLNREIWDAWVARQAVNAQLKTEGSAGFSTFNPIFKDLDDAFGKRVIEGEKSVIKFKGTKEQEFPWTGTIKDIADRPKLYDLTESQQRAIAAWNARNSDSLRKVNAEYGTDIGEFVNPQGFASPNIDVSEAVQEAIENLGRSQRAIFASGRGRTRIFETAFDRWKADPKFVPETSLRKLTLAWDEFKISSASNRTFKEGIGGKTRVEVIEELHPKLLAKKQILTRQVRNLRNRIQTAIRQAQATGRVTKTTTTALKNVESKAQILTDRIAALGEEFGPELSFLSGELRQVLAQARNLDKKALTASTKLELTSARKTTLVKELSSAIDELASVSRSYEAANLGDFKLIQEGIFRYFPSLEAGQISQITKTSNNSFISFIDNIRRGVLTLDASPIVGVQAPMMWLFDPIGTSRQWIKGAGKAISTGDLTSPFNKTALARDINSRPDQWADFAFYSGFPVGRTAPEEFGVGFWSKIPGIGPKIAQTNENMFNAVMRGMERMFREETQGLIADGMDVAQAKATAIDMVTKGIPLLNPSRLGLSQARASAFRASVISVSFIRKPAELMMDAARGMFKAGTGQRLTPKDKIAMRMMGTFAASISSISIMSAVLSARARGQDELAAVRDVTDPTSGRFMSIIIGNRSIPLGGPFRGIIKAMAPREVEGIPFPVPLANVHNFFLNRLTPFIKTQLDLRANEDFFRNPIIKGKALEQMARILWYEVEGILPISAKAISAAGRMFLDTGEVDIGDVAVETAVQVGGVNLLSETPFQFRDKQVIPWAKKQGLPDIESYYDLSPEFRQKFQKAEPEIFEEIEKETKRRARRGDDRSLRIVKSEEKKAEYTVQQLADDEEFNAGRMEPSQWRDRRRIRQARLNAQRDQLYEDLDTRDPETPTDFYYAKIDELEAKYNGIMTGEAWDELDQWVATLSPADQEFIEKNTRLGNFTPTVQAYFEANELLQGYWNEPERIALTITNNAVRKAWREWMVSDSTRRATLARAWPEVKEKARLLSLKRKFLREDNPNIDSALVRWYGSFPRTPQGEAIREQRIQGRRQGIAPVEVAPPEPTSVTGGVKIRIPVGAR